MIFDKYYLQNFKTLNVVFDEYGKFKIPVEEIAEIRCDAADGPYKKTDYIRILDGYIKISPKGAEVLEENYDKKQCHFDEAYSEQTEEYYILKNRIERYCDIVAFYLERENGEEIKFSLPYDPLIESIDVIEIELSNCPSAEIDEDGFITIGIGKSSKSPKRVDNNYDELIVGWKDLFKNFKPDILEAEIFWIMDCYEDNKQGLFVELKLLNKKVKHKPLQLIFSDCSNIHFSIYPSNGYKIELNMARLANGNIFVDFVGYGLTFECKEIHENNSNFYA